MAGAESGRGGVDDLLFEDDLREMGVGGSDAEAGGPLAGEDAGAGGGAEAVDIWRFAEGAAEDAGIAPAEVVGEDKDDVERAAGAA